MHQFIKWARPPVFAATAILAIAVFFFTGLHPAHSANFTLAQSTFSSGGAVSGSTSYTSYFVVGESFVGQATSTNYTAYFGLLSAVPGLPVGIGPDPVLPKYYSLDQNFPNPFNPTTTINYTLKEKGVVSVKVYNTAGQLVRTLVSEVQRPEAYSIPWDGKDNSGQDVASGVYFYRLITKNFSQTKKMVLIK